MEEMLLCDPSKEKVLCVNTQQHTHSLMSSHQVVKAGFSWEIGHKASSTLRNMREVQRDQEKCAL